MKKLSLFIILISITFTFCKTVPVSKNLQTIDVQGHRGCRGLLPENTIPAFKKAMDLGVTTLELDLVISKDKEVIISHEPFFSHEISTAPNGVVITEEDEKEHNLYQLTYEQIKAYDVGAIGHHKFPEQVALAVHKPSFRDMVREIEAYAKAKNYKSPLYNVEVKRVPEQDGIFHPGAEEFVDLVYQAIADLGIQKRTVIQSFDIKSLQIAHEKYPKIELVYLVINENSTEKNLALLGFTPEIYSPYFKMINATEAAFCQSKNMKLVPWTVNEVQDMESMIALRVEGIISDYPDRLIKLLQTKNIHIQ